jgi:type I restriction enzyme, S subunit
LIAEGKLKSGKELPSINVHELPFESPKGWVFDRIGNLMGLVNGRAFKPTDWSFEGLPIIRIQNLNNSNAPFNYCNFQVDEKFIIDNDDLLIGWSGTPGTSFGAFIWTRGKGVLNQHIFKAVLVSKNLLEIEYLKLAINSILEVMILKAHGGVGLQHITKGKFENIIIPLPPLPEQQRIVVKVQQLQQMVNQLEQQVANSQAQAQQLLQAVLKEAFAGKEKVYEQNEMVTMVEE